MNEYEVDLGNGITTTMQLSDADAEKYRNAKKVGKAREAKLIAPEARGGEDDREVAADATAAKRSRGTRETR